ncbi:MAG: putative Ig domain-containing protein [Holophagaceae bacterium]|nr:putative Ig domain-containing protein [Holophagaceae bacterium]
MKLKIYSVVFLALSSLALFAQRPSARRIPLEQGWVFNPADDPSFATVGLDDKTWSPVNVKQTWGEQGHADYKGTAWYRKSFMLPRAMRNEDRLKGGLILYIGLLEGGDQVFLNGQYLGTSSRVADPGTAPPPRLGAPRDTTKREYALPINDPRLKWGEENLIAVRVASPARTIFGDLVARPGGIIGGGQHVRMAGMEHFIDFQATVTDFVFNGQEVLRSFDILNTHASTQIRGSLTVEANGLMSGRQVAKNTTAINLAPGARMAVSVPLGQREEACRITYHIAFNDGAIFDYVEESPYILTPPIPNSPRINGASVFGARPGNPFLFTVPASGERPMTFRATGLPAGLSLNPQTGVITGTTPAAGTYKVAITAQNSRGTATRDLEIVAGDKLALTPPMGWNSWNVWGTSVDEEKVVASATTFVEKGLRNHGWTYINIDDGWEIRGSSPDPKRNEDGTIITNEKFPDMARLGRRVHDLGLKFGIYSGPGPTTCGGYTASYQHEQQDANSYASWGVDYLKYDLCSYARVVPDRSLHELVKPYEIMRQALSNVNRDIVYSLCQYGQGKVWKWGEAVGGNLWRITGDITDTWGSMSTLGFIQTESASYARPGAWNDPDMLVLGWLGWGPNLRRTRLTPDEQYMHMSLWCLLSSPLLLGCDPTRLDAFTLSLLTNDEVLAINQDRLGKQAPPATQDGHIRIMVKELYDGGRAIGIFNLGDEAADYEVDFRALGITGEKRLRDLWRQRDIGPLSGGKHRTRIAPHGAVLLKAI